MAEEAGTSESSGLWGSEVLAAAFWANPGDLQVFSLSFYTSVWGDTASSFE